MRSATKRITAMSKTLKYALITLAVGIVLLLIGHLFFSAKFFSETNDVSPVTSEIIVDSDQDFENPRKGFYFKSNNAEESIWVDSLFIYDITRDNIPEVWLITDDCEAERMVVVYSISDWENELYRDTAGHSMFYAGDGYILRQWAHMGHASWYKLQWDGKQITSKRIFEENTGFYSDPPEPPVVELGPEVLLEMTDRIEIR